MRRRRTAFAALLTLALCAPAAAQQSFPSQQMKMIVPFAAGALTDFLGRLAAEQIKTVTGQTVVVENRTGAGGNPGLAQIAQSTPDGHTIGIAGVTSFAVNPLIYKTMPLDPNKDLVVVAMIAEAPLALVVNVKALPFTSMRELVAHVRQNMGKYNYGSSGTGTPPHMVADQIFRQAGIQVQHVPYRGIAPATNDLVAGSVQMMLASPGSVIGHVDAGTLRFLVLAAPRRLGTLPDLPVSSEVGLPPATAISWWGVVAPSATPKPVVERLNAILGSMADDPQIRPRLEKIYMRPMKMSVADMAAQLASDLPVWARIVKDAGIKPE